MLHGSMRLVASANHAGIFVSSLITMGLLSYLIHIYYSSGTHIIYQEVIAVLTFVLYGAGMILPFFGSYRGHLWPMNMIFSYLWLTSFILAVEDWAGNRCYDKCGIKKTIIAFDFFAFLFLLGNTVAEAMLWRSNGTDAITKEGPGVNATPGHGHGIHHGHAAANTAPGQHQQVTV